MSDTNMLSHEDHLAAETPGEIELPTIMVEPPEHEVVDQALGCLAQSGTVFTRGQQLVYVGAVETGTVREAAAPCIVNANANWLRNQLSRTATFKKRTDTGPRRVLVPEWLPHLILERWAYNSLPPLTALVETPILLPGGGILEVPGLDTASGIFYAPMGEFPRVPEAPTREAAQEAAGRLLELVSDFPFASPAHRAAWLAALLTVAARYAIDGPVPFVLIDANGQGAGKGLLTTVTSILAIGRDPVSAVPSSDKEEFRKAILPVLMRGARTAWLDEVQSPFGGRLWNALVTATVYRDRILGSSKEWSGPHSTVWFVTGNNIDLTTDTPRRCLHVRLEPAEERPEDRQGFRFQDLTAHVKRHQAVLLSDALVMLRAFHLAGRPKHGLTPWGSFEAWSDLVRECVFWATGIDCDTRKELNATSDTTRQSSAMMLEELEVLFPQGRAFVAGDVFAKYQAVGPDHRPLYSGLREVLDQMNTNPKGVNVRGVGNLLKGRRGRAFAGLRLEGVAGGKQGLLWRVLRAGGGIPTGGPEGDAPEPPVPPNEDRDGGSGDSGGSAWPQSGEPRRDMGDYLCSGVI